MTRLFNRTLFLLAFLAPLPQQGTAQRSLWMERTRSHGHLGVIIQDITPDFKERKHLSVSSGVYVLDVEEDGPAAKAGVRQGDIILQLNDRTIGDGDDLIRALGRLKPNTDVTIGIVRGNDHKTLEATLDRDRLSSGWGPFGPGRLRLPKIPHLEIVSLGHVSGMSLQPITRQLADYFGVPDRHGLLVTDVESGSPAAKAGFRAGDVITQVAKRSVRDAEELREELEDFAGKEAPLEIIRNGKALSLMLHVESENEDEDDEDASLSTVPGDCFLQAPPVAALRDDAPGRRILDRVIGFLKELKTDVKSRLSSAARLVSSVLVRFHDDPSQTTVSSQTFVRC